MAKGKTAKGGAASKTEAKGSKPAAGKAPKAAPAKEVKPVAKAPAKPAAAKEASKAPAKSAPAPKETKGAKPAAPSAAAAVVAAAAGAPNGPLVPRKKKNVKRGAPPMLPRRGVRRPDPNAAPPPPRPATVPGSLHAPARAPEGVDQLKARLSTAMKLLQDLKGLKRSLQRQFFEAGQILQRLAEPELFKAKGYGSFESFVEREVERELGIGRSQVHDLVTITRVFQRDAAEELGLERLRAGLRALYPDASAIGAQGTGGSA